MIPQTFNTLNHIIEVVYDNEHCNKNNCLGQYLYQENKII